MRLRKIIDIVASAAVLLAFTLPAQGQKEPIRNYAWLDRYEQANVMLAASSDPGRVVLVGDSITDNWARMRPGFFNANGIIGRGIGGQTTPQMLLRFRRDVIENKAAAVAILAGTNDIAGNTGPCSLQDIVDNIADMCDIASANGVRTLICSVLPVHRYPWSRDKRPDVEIPLLNDMLRQLAADKGCTYVDYFSAMVDSDPRNTNGLPRALARDGVHPTNEGYEIMERLLLDNLQDEMAAHAAAHQGEALTLASYNVRNCLGLDDERNYHHTGEVIHSFGADAIAIQELDFGAERSNGDDVLGELAWITGMVPTFARAIDFQGGFYGVGMLTRELPKHSKAVPLPGREEQRVLLMAELSDCIFCCTHLSLIEEDQLASVDIIAREVAAFAKGKDKPVFLAGDWNAEPDSEVLRKISENFEILTDTSAFTFPAIEPAQTIDYIARWKGSPKGKLGTVAGTEVPAVPTASDHRPVKVILK